MEDVYLRSSCPIKPTVLGVVKAAYFRARVLAIKEIFRSSRFSPSITHFERFYTESNIKTTPEHSKEYL